MRCFLAFVCVLATLAASFGVEQSLSPSGWALPAGVGVLAVAYGYWRNVTRRQP